MLAKLDTVQMVTVSLIRVYLLACHLVLTEECHRQLKRTAGRLIVVLIGSATTKIKQKDCHVLLETSKDTVSMVSVSKIRARSLVNHRALVEARTQYLPKRAKRLTANMTTLAALGTYQKPTT